MKFYLSSFRVGEKTDLLKSMLPDNPKIALIENAKDYLQSEEIMSSNAARIEELLFLGGDIKVVDLKIYFGNEPELENLLHGFDLLWVTGGNCFVLREAMQKSGFSSIIRKFYNEKYRIIYGGYSAGICVLGPTLNGLHFTDSPEVKPYGPGETLWDGLGIIEYVIAPHYKSDHPESEMIDESIAYMKKHQIPHKPLRDGEVVIIQ